MFARRVPVSILCKLFVVVNLICKCLACLPRMNFVMSFGVSNVELSIFIVE